MAARPQQASLIVQWYTKGAQLAITEAKRRQVRAENFDCTIDDIGKWLNEYVFCGHGQSNAQDLKDMSFSNLKIECFESFFSLPASPYQNSTQNQDNSNDLDDLDDLNDLNDFSNVNDVNDLSQDLSQELSQDTTFNFISQAIDEYMGLRNESTDQSNTQSQSAQTSSSLSVFRSSPTAGNVAYPAFGLLESGEEQHSYLDESL